jgi:galactose mutarotase-like enzyme
MEAMAVTANLIRAALVSTALVFAAAPALAATATRASYGVTAAGAPVEIFTLKNDHGMTVKVLSYGGVITDVEVPDRKGQAQNVVLELADLKTYEARANFSSLLGRYANRISNGGFSIDGVRYDLPSSAEGVSSHGGPTGFSTRLWTGEPFKRHGGAGVTLTYTAVDGEGGYPGTLKVAVTYTVTRKNALRIDYRATTDKPTVINLSHHVYFNLAGGGNVYDQTAQVLAQSYTPINARKLATGEIAPVDRHGPGPAPSRSAAGRPRHGRRSANQVRQRLRPQLRHRRRRARQAGPGGPRGRPRQRPHPGGRHHPAGRPAVHRQQLQWNPEDARRAFAREGRRPGDRDPALRRQPQPPQLPLDRAAAGADVQADDRVPVRGGEIGRGPRCNPSPSPALPPAQEEIAMTDPKTNDADSLAKALKNQPKPDLDDQGDIAADDAGATAIAERVAKSAGVQGDDEAQD